MKKKTILFDLDGTLLPMDQDAFTRGYFKLLAQKLAPHGYDPAALVDNIWAGTAAMVGNDGKRTNEAAFWDRFAALYGEQVREDIPLFDAFYRQEFQQAKAFCGFTPKARAAVEASILAGKQLWACSCMENRLRELKHDGERAEITVKPYEILTLKIC